MAWQLLAYFDKGTKLRLIQPQMTFGNVYVYLT